MKAHYFLSDENNDKLMDCVIVVTKEFEVPLIGDYRGVQLAIIPFSNEEGKILAEKLARLYCNAIDKEVITV